jgi:hypothetical protein
VAEKLPDPLAATEATVAKPKLIETVSEASNPLPATVSEDLGTPAPGLTEIVAGAAFATFGTKAMVPTNNRDTRAKPETSGPPGQPTGRSGK